MSYWVRVRLGDAPPLPAVPVTDSEPRWARATGRAAVVDRPARTAADDASETETRKTWLVDSFELVVPRYPWQKET
ncbi:MULTISPECIES: hypothetical protein [Saccharothrix]|uniref:hypothetical protein n=1 Tax=Saccharothrix TaxID=2071 RepID=UPI00093AFA94|nr:hypothetical protein [Saccharothrix sp. CB00851]